MSLITAPNYESLVLRQDGSLSSANSSGEVLTITSNAITGNSLTVSGSSNASVNGTYTANGTYGGETAYEGTNGWIFYATYWCWHPTKIASHFDASYISNTLTGRYIQLGGEDSFDVCLATSNNTTSVFTTDTAHVIDLIADHFVIGDVTLDYNSAGYATVAALGRELDYAHNGNKLLRFPIQGEGNAIALFCGLETRLSGSGEDYLYDFEGEYGKWVANDNVHVNGSLKTPNTYTMSVNGVTSVNDIVIQGWEVKSPSDASRYMTEIPMSSGNYLYWGEFELLVDPDDCNLKIETLEAESGNEVALTEAVWKPIGYDFPTEGVISTSDYNDCYKLALTTHIGDFRDYPLANLTIEAETLNSSANAVRHTGVCFSYGRRVLLSGSEDAATPGSPFYDVAATSTNTFEYNPLTTTGATLNTSNGVIGFDGNTYVFATINAGGYYFKYGNYISVNSLVTLNTTGSQNTSITWLGITRGPSSGNSIYGLGYYSGNTYVLKQTTYPTATTNGTQLSIQSGRNWDSLSLAYTGNIYGLPSTANGHVLKINTTNDVVTTINCGNCPAVRQTILAPNGMLFGFPDNYTQNVIKFDPSTETMTLLAAVGTQNETRYQGFCDASGKLVVFPADFSSSNQIIVYDPVAETAQILTTPNTTTYGSYLGIVPVQPGLYYRYDNYGKAVHKIKLYSILDTDRFYHWIYSSYNHL